MTIRESMTLIARAEPHGAADCKIQVFDADHRPLRSAVLPCNSLTEGHGDACWTAIQWAREAAKNPPRKLKLTIVTPAEAGEVMQQQLRWAARHDIELLFVTAIAEQPRFAAAAKK